MNNKQTYFIGDKEAAPQYTVDNRYLHTGYRVNYNTYKLALKSIFHIHNETCNIWTHGIPLIISIIMVLYTMTMTELPFKSILVDAEWKQDKSIAIWPMQYLLFSMVLLFAISTIYHTLFCVNEFCSCTLLRLDYGGIYLILNGGIIPIIQYGFYCNEQLRTFYSLFSTTICVFGLIVNLYDRMHKEHNVHYKVLIQIILFTTNFIPSFHLVIYSKMNMLGEHFHLHDIENYFLFIIFCLLVGISFYASRFPEKYYPKKFDIFINSHSIWHIFVVLGVSGVYMYGMSMYAIRQHYGCK